MLDYRIEQNPQEQVIQRKNIYITNISEILDFCSSTS